MSERPKALAKMWGWLLFALACGVVMWWADPDWLHFAARIVLTP
jgi:hypothetical protein